MNTIKHKLFNDNLLNCVACGSLDIYDWAERKPRNKNIGNLIFKLSKCNICKHIFINPIPAKKLLEDIYEKSGHGLSEPITLQQVELAEKEYPNAIIDSKRLVTTAKNNKIWNRQNMNIKLEALDIGSGYGFYTAAAKKEGFKVTAVNPSVWENDIFEQMNGFRPIQSFFEDIVFAQKFDLIILSQVLEHVAEPLTFLNRIKSIMSEGAVLAIAVPNLYSYLVKLGKDGGVFWIPEHLNCFTKKSLQAVLSRAEFDIMQIQGISRFPYFAISNKLGLKGYPRIICNFSFKLFQYIPLKIIDYIGWSGVLNIWVRK